MPAGGKLTLEQLDTALNATNLSTQKRIALKGQIYAAGMLIEPERPVDAAAVRYVGNLLRQHRVEIACLAAGQVPRIADVDAACAKANVGASDRVHIKCALDRAGLLDNTGTVVQKPPMPVPRSGVATSIFASFDIDVPESGKVTLAQVNKAMAAKDLPPRRRIEIKATLSAAGVL